MAFSIFQSFQRLIFKLYLFMYQKTMQIEGLEHESIPL